MLRKALLQTAFALLYAPLAPLHEIVGRVAFGPSWPGRRSAVLNRLRDEGGLLLDLGCGEGRVLALAQNSGRTAVGVEPSSRMCQRAREAGSMVVLGEAAHIPLRTGAVSSVCVTYPGPWITEPSTWCEIARVVRSGGTVLILLGGTVERGRGARARAIVGWIAYGCGFRRHEIMKLPDLGNELVHGEWTIENDAWGTAHIWRGSRTGESGT